MTKRNVIIDIYKGIAIILIVLGHLETTKLIKDSIFLFHVPAFFFVAGMTFRVKEKERLGDFLKKKAYRLLLPYLFYVLIMSATQIVTDLYVNGASSMSGSFSFKGFCLATLDILLCGDIEGTAITIGPSWFLYVLFEASLLFRLVNRLKISKIAAGSGIIALFFIAVKTGWFNEMSIKLGQSISAMFYMWCGQLFGAKSSSLLKMKPLALLVLAFSGMGIVLSTAWYLGDSINMAGNYFPSSLACITIVTLVGSISLYLLSICMNKVKLGSIMAFYGINSMLVLGLHIPLRNISRLVFSRICLSLQQSSLPTFMLIMLISIPLIMMVNKYIPILVGMKKQKNILL